MLPARNPADARLQSVIDFFETLLPDTLIQLQRLYTPRARFVDPFNDVQGHKALHAIFEDMFLRTHLPRFRITGSVQQGDDAFLTWDFDFSLPSRPARTLTVKGSTHLHFAPDGRVDLHRDYWDAAGELYGQLPVLGLLMRALKRRLAVHAQT